MPSCNPEKMPNKNILLLYNSWKYGIELSCINSIWWLITRYSQIFLYAHLYIIIKHNYHNRRTAHSVCFWNTGYGSTDPPSDINVATMHEKPTVKFYSTSPYHPCRLYICWERIMGTTGNNSTRVYYQCY